MLPPLARLARVVISDVRQEAAMGRLLSPQKRGPKPKENRADAGN